MRRNQARFTQSEIVRAIRAISQSGGQMAMEILNDGTIRIVPIGPSSAEQDPLMDERQGIIL